jgi:hypothetical protein
MALERSAPPPETGAWPTPENQQVSQRPRLVQPSQPVRPGRGTAGATPARGTSSAAPTRGRGGSPPAPTAPAAAVAGSVAAQRTTAAPPPAPAREDDAVVVFFFWVAIAAVIWGARRLRRSRQAAAPPAGARAAHPAPPHETPRAHAGDARRARITFAEPRTDTLWRPDEPDLTDVRDAVTGQPLRPALGLYRCTRCHVFYQMSSVECIQRDNGGRCVSCGSVSVSPLDGAPAGGERTYGQREEITTLADYRSRVNQLVVFEGRCVRVLQSRSGTAYAVMFEDTRWTEGFKLVVRTGFVAHVGGDGFIRSLEGRTIRARGVIVHSPTFGYEITITARSMILGVS